MRKGRIITSSIILVWLVLAFTPLVIGWEYYLTPFADRPFHPLHELYKPTGLVGHGLGIFGSLFIIIGVATYSTRKRIRFLQRWSKLKYWLHFHIFLCTLGPFWVLLHTTFKFSGLVAISFWSMMLVVASGVFGRYVYARIPKTLNGVFLDDEQIRNRYRTLKEELVAISGLSAEDIENTPMLLNPNRHFSIGQAVVTTIKLDMARFISDPLTRLLESYNLSGQEREEAHRLTRQLMLTSRQLAIKQPFQKIFGYWHVLHIPLTAVMFIILLVHVIVAVMFGYTWIL